MELKRKTKKPGDNKSKTGKTWEGHLHVYIPLASMLNQNQYWKDPNTSK